MSTRPLRLGTRRSALATAQSSDVARALEQVAGVPVELVPVTTYGDRSRESLASIGGTGVFVSALREALLEDRVDLAVHSLKDLPTTPAAGLALAAVPRREDPRDVLVARDGRTLADLAPGARVGTGSPRRAAQLRALGLGLDVVDLRGNVDTRLRHVSDGDLDAVVLARAGLARLGRLDAATEVLDPEQVLPAAGQGALAVECRADDDEVRAALARLDDALTRAAVTAERALLAALEAGCTAPIGALAEPVDDPDGAADLVLQLRAVVASPDGSVCLRRSATAPVQTPGPDAPPPSDDSGSAAFALGTRLARTLLDSDVAALLPQPTGERVP